MESSAPEELPKTEGVDTAGRTSKPDEDDPESELNPEGVDAAGQPLQPEGSPASAEIDPQGAAAESSPHFAGSEAAGAAVASRPGQSMTRLEILVRARSWLHPPVPYSQHHFKRGYRTDCSGYVSMAWHTKGNYYTGSLHTISHPIPYRDLRAGDILLRAIPGDSNRSHVVIFEAWVGAVGGDFLMYEQTGGRVRHTIYRKWSDTRPRRPDNPWEGRPSNPHPYKPFRYDKVREDPKKTPV